MLQTKDVYPIFVPDQVLTSGDLNEAFDYLDQQERLTRVGLIGSGNVCGFQVTLNANGSLTIGAGSGISTEGYLISAPATTYTQYHNFPFKTANAYPPFCSSSTLANPNSLGTFHTDELLVATASVPDTDVLTPLSNTYLFDKVLILLYDLNNVSGQNCNPESCDGLGTEVQITIRALLASQSDINIWLGQQATTSTGSVSSSLFYSLADLSMPRFNVPPTSTGIINAGQFYAAYNQLYPPQLVSSLGGAFNSLYGAIQPLVALEFPNNPFAGFSSYFAFLNDGTLSQPSNLNTLLNLQYIWDFFQDMISSYDEIREKGYELSGACCVPDTFPRHLFLGLLQYDSSGVNIVCDTTGVYYYPFTPSMAIGTYNSIGKELVMLFRRLVLQFTNFKIPSVNLANNNQTNVQIDSTIVLTPDVYGRAPFSAKSIPFYYNVPIAQPPLQNNWNYSLAVRNKGNRVLSYYAPTYNTTDDDIIEPFKYSWEPSNFIRVEGIIGKNVSSVLYNLQTLRSKYRVPFDITVTTVGNVNTSSSSIISVLQQYNQIPTGYFSDLEVDYNSAVSEIIHRFVKVTEVIYGIERVNLLVEIRGERQPPAQTAFLATTAFMKENAPTFMVQPNTAGYFYEKSIYPGLSTRPYQTPVFPTSDFVSGNIGVFGISMAGYFSSYTCYVMENVFDLLIDLPTFASSNLTNFNNRYQDMENLCDQIVSYIDQAESSTDILLDISFEDVKLVLSDLRSLGKAGVMTAIANEYTKRLTNYLTSISFNQFITDHPGILHRGGVLRGGTLVLVVYLPTSSPTTTDLAAAANIPREKVAESAKDITLSALDVAPGAFGMYQFDAMFLTRLRTAFATSFDYSVALENAISSSAITSGCVIGEFFLPEGSITTQPPVQLSLNISSQPPFLNINPAVYYIDDANPSLAVTQGLLQYGPPGGSLYVDGSTTPDSGTDFAPADFFTGDFGPPISPNFDATKYAFAEGQITRAVPFRYEYNGTTSVITAYIYKMPIASFIDTTPFTYVSPGVYTVNFDYSASQNFDRVMWTFGDGQVQNINSPVPNSEGKYVISHNYTATTSKSYTATVTAYNGTLMSIYTLTFQISPAVSGASGTKSAQLGDQIYAYFGVVAYNGVLTDVDFPKSGSSS